MKKIFTLLLAMAMVLTLASCGEKTVENLNTHIDFEIGDTGGLKVPFGNGEELSVFVTDEVGATNTYIFDKLGQIVGLKVTPILAPVSSSTQKMQTLLASGNLPDIMSAGTLNQTNDYAMQGAWEPINDHLDEMPNFKRIFGEGTDRNWIFKSLAATDGKLYVFPVIDSNRVVNHGMLYRKDIFDKHGIEMWNSPETFYETLKKLKELYPDSYPLTSKMGVGIISHYGTSWGGLCAYDVYYDEENKTWKYSDTDPKMKDLLDFFHKLYKEGLLDPEFLTNTQPAWTKRMTTGSSFVTFDWIGRLDMFVSQSEIEGYDLRYANPVGPAQTLITLEQVSRSGNVVSKGKNAALAMKLQDFWYSDAGAELMTCGVRGETFEFAEDGTAKYIEFEEGKKIDIMDIREKYCMMMSGSYKKIDKRSCYFQFSEREQEAQDWVEKCNGLEPENPVVTFVGDDVSRAADLKTALSKEFEVFMFNYIIGQNTGDKAWDEWVKKAEQLGANEFAELYNKRHKELGL